MNKTVLVVVSLICATAIACFLIYTKSNRYVTANAGFGIVYKIDRQTGRTVYLQNSKEYEVESSELRGEEDVNLKAIRLAKNAYNLDPKSMNETVLMNRMRSKVGPLKIIGWNTVDIDGQTKLVSFMWDQGDGSVGFVFEVNLAHEIVRKVTGDILLEEKYNVYKR
jgi:hypothetical protein